MSRRSENVAAPLRALIPNTHMRAPLEIGRTVNTSHLTRPRPPQLATKQAARRQRPHVADDGDNNEDSDDEDEDDDAGEGRPWPLAPKRNCALCGLPRCVCDGDSDGSEGVSQS